MFFSAFSHKWRLMLIIILYSYSRPSYGQTPQEISAQLTAIELSFFNEKNQLNFTTPRRGQKLLMNRVEILETTDPTLEHLLLARTLYLGAMLQPDHYTIADIFQAVMIEEALIPISMGLQYNTDLLDEDKSLFKELLISFYITQARYYFLQRIKQNKLLQVSLLHSHLVIIQYLFFMK